MYELIKFPKYFVSFEALNKKETERFFQWYIAQSESRIEILKEYVKHGQSNNNLFDYSPESLIPLYGWYEGKIEMEERSEEDYQAEYETTDDKWKKYVPKEQFSHKTYSLIVDIAYYFAEIMMRQHQTIHWGYFIKPKSRMSVNSPVLLGFRYDKDLNPRLILENCSSGYIKRRGRKNPEELYEKYLVWCKNVIDKALEGGGSQELETEPCESSGKRQ